MANDTSTRELKIDRLEDQSVDAMLSYLASSRPADSTIDKARFSLGVFGSIQRRRSAINNEALLELMSRRVALTEPRPVGSSDGGATS